DLLGEVGVLLLLLSQLGQLLLQVGEALGRLGVHLHGLGRLALGIDGSFLGLGGVHGGLSLLGHGVVFLVQPLDLLLDLLLLGDELDEVFAEGVLGLLEGLQLLVGGVGVGGDADDVLAGAGRLPLAVFRLGEDHNWPPCLSEAASFSEATTVWVRSGVSS